MADWHVGTATADITPPAQGYWMGGFLPRRRAEKLHRPLLARVAVLEAGGRKVVWIALDLLTFRNTTARAIRQRVWEAVGVRPADVWVMATHTHSGPDLVGLFGGPPRGYETLLVGRVTEAVRRALAGRVPAGVTFGEGTVGAWALNRREVDTPLHDETLAVLTARDRRGRRVLTLVNTSCHPVVMHRQSPWVSPDFVGGLCDAVEASVGGMAMFVNRAHGDVNPNVDVMGIPMDNTDPHHAETFGGTLARHALDVVADRPVAPVLGTRLVSRRVPVTRPGMVVLGAMGFGELGADLRLRTEFAGARLGDLLVVGLPGELFGRLTRRVREAAPDAGLVFGLQGGYAGYVMTPQEETPSGYEEKLYVGPGLPDAMVGFAKALNSVLPA